MSIQRQLRLRFPAPEWAIFFEVANGLGANSRRYADAVAMSLFPSRGLDVHGFEVKTARADWLRELKDPAKADEIAKYCDFWWLVIGDEKVADKNEVPRTWGLLVSKDGELRQTKRAERMKPKAIDRSFMGAMFRRSDEWVKAQLESDTRLVEAKEAGRKLGLEERDWQQGRDAEDLKKLQQAVKEFEDASGVSISRWDAGNVGEAVKAFMYSMKHDVTEDIERVAGWAEGMAQDLRKRAELIKKNRPQSPATPAQVPQ
jgi:hypothetical protein